MGTGLDMTKIANFRYISIFPEANFFVKNEKQLICYLNFLFYT